MPHIEDFKELKFQSVAALKKRDLDSNKEYLKRLRFEFKEIEKQGAGNYWVQCFNESKTWDHNKNGLLLPFLLGMTDIDPIQDNIEHNVEYHPDFPDIDIDFLPHARDPIKKYAEEKYGKEHVCSVGLWLRYKPKLALQDAAAALGKNRFEVIALSKNLPDEFDQMSFKQAIEEFENFAEFAEENPDVCELAYKMVGKIKSQGKHAGGLIISSIPIKDYVPLTLCGEEGNKQWTSAWIEGMADTQLSKFGFVKFDILGLLNLSYIWNCIRLVKKSKNLEIRFEDTDPREDRAGWIIKPDGSKEKILLNDPKTLKAADKIKLTSIFQFDTDFAQSIVEKGGVKSFMDLVIYTSLGRPGPLPMIDVYIENRDAGEEYWKSDLHPIMQDVLDSTAGVLCFQEQLLRTWTELCAFTMPEAEKAQKAVKKKKTEILDEIKPKVIKGAANHIGEDKARELWDTMVSFGRYCFNKSHAVAYIVTSYRCLWLKTHFPSEWWAAALSECPATRFVKYIGAARAEGIDFGSIDIRNLSVSYTVKDERILPGLTSIKGIGVPTAKSVVQVADEKPFESVKDFVNRYGKSKGVLERVIKLGGFDHLNPNRKLLWRWYQFLYDSGKDVTRFRRQVKWCFVWDQKDIDAEINRQKSEYARLYPKRKRIPKKILNWLPSTLRSDPKPFDPEKDFDSNNDSNKQELKLINKIKTEDVTFDQFRRLFNEDFTYAEKLVFEKEYLGYYWHSPLEMYNHNPKNNLEKAKETGLLDCVIEEIHTKDGARGKYKILNVTDGTLTARVNVWKDIIDYNDEEVFQEGIGVRMRVNYQEKWKSFAVQNDTEIMPLSFKDEAEIAQ